MRKKMALFLVLAMVILTFAACGGSKTDEAPPEDNAATGAVKTGLAVITTADKSVDAGESNGVAEADSLAVAVMVDDAGKIVKCSIDQAQTKIEFGKDGKIVTPLDTVFAAKKELGKEYGMAKASSIGKEWNEQADAFAAYVTGKTVDEVKGIAVNEEGVPTGSDLTSSVTIHVTEFIAGIEKAVSNAKAMGAAADDKLGLGLVTTIDKSTDAGAEDGLAQAYTYYTATTFTADGAITSSIIDASQTNINFSKEGKITSDLKADFQTKNELGDAYGMKKASSIGKEWNEQAASFAEYVVGKNINEVKGIAVTDGVPSGEDLKTSVTIHVTDLITVLEKALNDAE
ncbi:hypothetical protein Ami103574_12355 [Aminipila butyrica]|uniref:Uncharacterized protein n=1 Tax=Aminipila butyrica TaxID=433296 RepID=A0A858BYR7_9FIRM|nr:hypothetical protein [Aminipila butyrica]QIB70040.1 hypothetical protein Ami103574_12355 [Aminipila butyrica]